MGICDKGGQVSQMTTETGNKALHSMGMSVRRNYEWHNLQITQDKMKYNQLDREVIFCDCQGPRTVGSYRINKYTILTCTKRKLNII